MRAVRMTGSWAPGYRVRCARTIGGDPRVACSVTCKHASSEARKRAIMQASQRTRGCMAQFEGNSAMLIRWCGVTKTHRQPTYCWTSLCPSPAVERLPTLKSTICLRDTTGQPWGRCLSFRSSAEQGIWRCCINGDRREFGSLRSGD